MLDWNKQKRYQQTNINSHSHFAFFSGTLKSFMLSQNLRNYQIERTLIMSSWRYLIKSLNCPIVHSRPPRDLYILLIAINQTKDFNRQSIREMFGRGWRSEMIFQGWPDVTRGDMHVLISSAALYGTCLFTALQLSTLKAYSLRNPFRKCWSTLKPT